jgi:hypothetical protein
MALKFVLGNALAFTDFQMGDFPRGREVFGLYLERSGDRLFLPLPRKGAFDTAT